MKSIDISRTVEVQGGKVSLNLEVHFHREGKIFFASCHSLNLAGYGYTEAEAWKSFEIVLQEYISYGQEHNTLLEDLKKHGVVNNINL